MNAGPRVAPVHCAAGLDGDTNFGTLSLAAPTGCKIVPYLLTDPRQFDILQFGPGCAGTECNSIT